MNRQPRMTVLWAGVLAAALLAPGCKSKVEEMSTATYVLDLFEKVWGAARESLASPQPNLHCLRSVEIVLDGRTRRAVELDYHGANKEMVLAKLDALADAWTKEMMVMAEPNTFAVKLKSGYTVEHVRTVFNKLDKDFAEIQAMVAGR